MKDIKIKYLIGAEKDLPDYPTQADLFFYLEDWWTTKGSTKYKKLNKSETFTYIISDKDFLNLVEPEHKQVCLDFLSKYTIIKELESKTIFGIIK